MSESQSPGRGDDLQHIRATYERYRVDDRARLWDLRNRGFARAVRQRDRGIAEYIHRSLPNGGGRVLDLGCGDGRLANVVRARGLPVQEWIGVDIDPSAIERARQEAPWATFIEASADRLPFPDHTIDVVLASVIFSSLPTEALERAVAREIERALRQGGWLVWYDLRRDNPWNPAVHGIDATRLASLFPGWQAQLRRTTLLPPLARRLGVTTALLYPLLERLPVLRSHLIGRLRSPVA